MTSPRGMLHQTTVCSHLTGLLLIWPRQAKLQGHWAPPRACWLLVPFQPSQIAPHILPVTPNCNSSCWTSSNSKWSLPYLPSARSWRSPSVPPAAWFCFATSRCFPCLWNCHYKISDTQTGKLALGSTRRVPMKAIYTNLTTQGIESTWQQTTNPHP